MPRSLQEILDHADELVRQFEDYEPDDADRRPIEPLQHTRAAVLARARAEEQIAYAVSEMRSAAYSWATIGSVLGTSGEAARQRYDEPVTAPPNRPAIPIPGAVAVRQRRAKAAKAGKATKGTTREGTPTGASLAKRGGPPVEP